MAASAYFPGDGTIPPPEVVKLVHHFRRNNIQLLIGCDANAHSQTWGSTDDNERGEFLLDFLTKENLNVSNIGNRPTFVTTVRQEVLDLTIGSDSLCGHISRWRVSGEPSFSDHKIIMFDLVASGPPAGVLRSPRNTDWARYKEDLTLNLTSGPKHGKICHHDQLDYFVDGLNKNIVSAYSENCKTSAKKSDSDVTWWNPNLEQLRKDTRKLFNRAKRTQDWEEYKKTLTNYRRGIRKAKRDSYRRFCEGIKHAPSASRLYKVISKDKGSTIATLMKPDGNYTENEEQRASLLLKTPAKNQGMDGGCQSDHQADWD